jgi:hypothetical protein
MLVAKSVKVPLGGGNETVTVMGVLIRQLSPTGVTVAVPGNTPISAPPEAASTLLFDDTNPVGALWQEPVT